MRTERVLLQRVYQGKLFQREALNMRTNENIVFKSTLMGGFLLMHVLWNGGKVVQALSPSMVQMGTRESPRALLAVVLHGLLAIFCAWVSHV